MSSTYTLAVSHLYLYISLYLSLCTSTLTTHFILFVIVFPFIFVFFFSTNFFFPQLLHCRYGRVQSVKIITSSGTVPAITSTTESQTGEHKLVVSSSTHHHHHSTSIIGKCHQTNSNNNINNNCSNNSNASQPTVGSNSLHSNPLEQSNGTVGGVTSCSIISNVSSSNQSSYNGMPAIGICATVAFMDIKSASKAHLAEHKFDDRILTTEYYEPTAMQQHSTSTMMGEGGSIVINNKMNDNIGDMKQETAATIPHGRYTSTSSHGLVLLWISSSHFSQSILIYEQV